MWKPVVFLPAPLSMNMKNVGAGYQTCRFHGIHSNSNESIYPTHPRKQLNRHLTAIKPIPQTAIKAMRMLE